MDGHLIAVEVRVVRRADERMQMDGFALHEHGFECLNTETMQRRCAVEQHRMLANDFIEHVPHFGTYALDHTLCALDVVRLLTVDELLHHERLEEFERHFFRETALMQLQVRTDDDNRTAGIVNALTEQVLTEAALFAFENIRQ